MRLHDDFICGSSDFKLSPDQTHNFDKQESKEKKKNIQTNS